MPTNSKSLKSGRRLKLSPKTITSQIAKDIPLKKVLPSGDLQPERVDLLELPNEITGNSDITIPNDQILAEQSDVEGINSIERELLDKIVNDNLDNQAFNRNIAKDLPKKALDKLAAYLEEATKKDEANRQPWLDIIDKAKPFLGFEIEGVKSAAGIESELSKSSSKNKSSSKDLLTKTYDATFASSVLRLWTILRSELLPATGPVGF